MSDAVSALWCIHTAFVLPVLVRVASCSCGWRVHVIKCDFQTGASLQQRTRWFKLYAGYPCLVPTFIREMDSKQHPHFWCRGSVAAGVEGGAREGEARAGRQPSSRGSRIAQVSHVPEIRRGWCRVCERPPEEPLWPLTSDLDRRLSRYWQCNGWTNMKELGLILPM